MSEHFDRWRTILLAALHRELKPLGFRKINFSRLQNGIWSTVNLQSSMWNQGDKFTVYLNVGIYFDNPKGDYNRKRGRAKANLRPPHSAETTST